MKVDEIKSYLRITHNFDDELLKNLLKKLNCILKMLPELNTKKMIYNTGNVYDFWFNSDMIHAKH